MTAAGSPATRQGPRGRGAGSVLVVGSGLIGTSVALALRARDVTVWLRDVDRARLRAAVHVGAGRVHHGEPVDLAVVAVPVPQVAAVSAGLLVEQPELVVTDVASVKGVVQSGLRRRRADLHRFVGGHPVAGSERSGPRAARGDLFQGRPWVLCPPVTAPATLRSVHRLVRLCGARPVEMTAAEHDRALAVTSHLPQLLASTLAGQLTRLPDSTVRLAGAGLADMTRIAASDPALWAGIATANAPALADALGGVCRALDRTARALRNADPARAAGVVVELLAAGRAGRARLPGKHGGRPRRFTVVTVVVADQPGELARLLATAGSAGANVEDLRIDHAPGAPSGLVALHVQPKAAASLRAALTAAAWQLRPAPG